MSSLLVLSLLYYPLFSVFQEEPERTCCFAHTLCIVRCPNGAHLKRLFVAKQRIREWSVKLRWPDAFCCRRTVFSSAGDRFTCDDVDVGIRVFAQLRAVAVPLEGLAQLLLHGGGAAQAIEAHNLEHKHAGQVSQKPFDRELEVFYGPVDLNVPSALRQCAGLETSQPWQETQMFANGSLLKKMTTRRILIWYITFSVLVIIEFSWF